ncbi:hypothetical protein HOLleu_10405 [Holothuria leucospilota]|uniref:Uncharacterized protein n=1 Tax=Holothuria leucospilota TaxID=206669 RepID=A0A9Q1CF41_HOLLE|nr:hypothetical protein HOLleu_10405 [Holothuria leucospilota]
MLICLRRIVEIICAPQISHKMVAYLSFLLDEYIHLRTECFPDMPLRPKHHFVMHYPSLILAFGPLMKLCTLRFESKHSYFKNCLRCAKNFKNVTHTLSEQHQLLQAYISSGSLFDNCLQFGKCMRMNIDLYSKPIKTALYTHYKCSETIACLEVAETVIANNILYEMGCFVVLEGQCDSYLLGRILLIVKQGKDNVNFILQSCSTYRWEELGILCVTHEEAEKVLSATPSELKDFYPLYSQRIQGCEVIALKHAILYT